MNIYKCFQQFKKANCSTTQWCLNLHENVKTSSSLTTQPTSQHISHLLTSQTILLTFSSIHARFSSSALASLSSTPQPPAFPSALTVQPGLQPPPQPSQFNPASSLHLSPPHSSAWPPASSSALFTVSQLPQSPFRASITASSEFQPSSQHDCYN